MDRLSRLRGLAWLDSWLSMVQSWLELWLRSKSGQIICCQLNLLYYYLKDPISIPFWLYQEILLNVLWELHIVSHLMGIPLRFSSLSLCQAGTNFELVSCPSTIVPAPYIDKRDFCQWPQGLHNVNDNDNHVKCRTSCMEDNNPSHHSLPSTVAVSSSSSLQPSSSSSGSTGGTESTFFSLFQKKSCCCSSCLYPKWGVSDIDEHPMEQLTEEADDAYRAKLSGQSKTLEAAVQQHKKQYQQFDQWQVFAKKNNMKMVDGYDGLMNDLRPFWETSAEELRQRAVQVCWIEKKKTPFLVLILLWNRWCCCPLSTLCRYKVVCR